MGFFPPIDVVGVLQAGRGSESCFSSSSRSNILVCKQEYVYMEFHRLQRQYLSAVMIVTTNVD